MALVTKSYEGDFALCVELCASIDRHMPDTRHYLLVDADDLDVFEPLANTNRRIVNCDTLLPDFRGLSLFGKRVWWRPPQVFVRGWIYQQLAKIAFVASMEEEAAVHIDSDLFFLGPIRDRLVFYSDQVRLLRNPGGGRTSQHERWHRTAQRLLGLPVTGYQGIDYIGPGVVWSPAIVREMIDRIEETNGKRWFDALATNFRFSEYLLYGTFCDQIGRRGKDELASGNWDFCHMSWHFDLGTPRGLEAFVQNLKPDHACVLIQSNLGLKPSQRKQIIRLLSERVAQA